jgi:mannose-6-phosphate isomerase-like protein (cupin superfamily)
MSTEPTARPTRPTVVPPAERVIPAGVQTPGLRREQAFMAPDRWIGYVAAEPGEWGAWHHHGATDTYFYVLQGGFEFEFGSNGETVSVGAGDFCFVPKGIVHRERPLPGAPAEVVLVRIGDGPSVVNVDGPGHDH